MHLKPETVSGSGLPSYLRPALGVAGEAKSSIPLPAGGETRLLLQSVVERHGITEELCDIGVRAELTDEAGRVPGRPGRELRALEEQRVGNAHFAEVIGDRAADNPSPDNNDLRGLRKSHYFSIAANTAYAFS
jgi:hypothetical protein